jgi:dephospho-CoA kinase
MPERTENRIIFPTGHHASGKTELCKYLTEAHGFSVIETGSMMRSLYNEREEDYEGLSITDYVKQKLAVDESFFDRKLEIGIREAEEASGQVVVNGMRSYGNVARIRDSRPDATHAIIWIDAVAEILHERYMARENIQISFEEFCTLLETDMSLGLGEIEKNADFRINNEGSISRLREGCDAILPRLGERAIEFLR